MKANAIGTKALYNSNKSKDFTYSEYVKIINCINLKFKEELLKGNPVSFGHLGTLQIKKFKITEAQRHKKFFRFTNTKEGIKREEVFTNPLEEYISILKWNTHLHFAYWKIKTFEKFRKEITNITKDEIGHKRFIEI